jgi:hypothetical protein
MAPKLYIEHSLSLLFFYRYDWFAAVLMNYWYLGYPLGSF